MKLIFLLHLAATLYMTGVIWFVQVVHYPLFSRVHQEFFAAYGAAHGRLTTWVVAPPMLVELATALLLVWSQPIGISCVVLGINLVLLAIIWLSTWLLQVPRHKHLRQAFDEKVHHALVLTNWLRTIAWSVRSLIMLWVAARALR